MMRQPPGWLLPLLIAFLLLLGWVGLRGIGFDDIWYDEYRTMWYAGAAEYGPASLATTWARVSENAVQTPGYYLLVNRWERLVGESVLALRYASVLFGLLAVALVYRAGLEVVSWRVGLAAAVLMGGSAFYTLFLHEMRTYTLVTAAVAGVTWGYWRLLNGATGWRTQAGFVLAVALLPYTHYYAMMVGGAVALFHLLFAPKTWNWFRVPILMALAVVPFLPWASVMLRGALAVRGDEARVIYALTVPEALGGVVGAFSGGSPLAWLLLAVLGVGFGGRGGRYLLGLASLTIVLALLANAWSASLSQVRYLLMLFPLLALVAALGAARLARLGVPLVLPVGLWLAAGLWQGVDPTYVTRVHNADWYFPWTQTVSTILPQSQPDDHLLVQLPHLTGAFGHEPLVQHYLHGTTLSGQVVDYPFFMTQADYTEHLRAAVSGHERLWVAHHRALVDDIDHRLLRETLSATGYVHCGAYADQRNLRLDLFANVPAAPQYTFGDGVAVAPLAPPPADNRLAVTLRWAVADDVSLGLYSYGVQVTDAAGTLVAGADEGLPTGRACSPVVLDLSSLPPGDYTAGLVVYNWQTNDRLSFGEHDILPLTTWNRP